MRFTVTFERVKQSDIPAIMASGAFESCESYNITNFATGIGPSSEVERFADVRAHTNIADWDQVGKMIYDLPMRIHRHITKIEKNG